MPRFDADIGVRELSAIAQTSGRGRILNLHAVHLANSTDPAFSERPMFRHPLLNRTILAKHFPSDAEAARLGSQRMNPTKVIFPFDPGDLTLGGQFLFVEQPSFEYLLKSRLDYPTAEEFSRDLAALRLLDDLPTLDPFLVRQNLAKQGLDVADCYFELSAQEQEEMLAFVEGEMQSLLDLCAPGIAAGDARSAKMAGMILSGKADPQLEILRLTLRVNRDVFIEAMFTWKAFLYYRWRAVEISASVKALQRSFSQIRSRYDRQETRLALNRARTLARRAITLISQDIAQLLRRYSVAYEALVLHRNPEVFRQFLLSGAQAYTALGDKIGRLEQMTSYWAWRFPPPGPMSAPTEMLLDAFRDLLQAAPQSTLAKLEPPGDPITADAA